MEFLGADEAANVPEDPDYLAVLGGVSSRGHAPSVLAPELYSGIIPVILSGMILKRHLVAGLVALVALGVVGFMLMLGATSYGPTRPVIVAGVSQWGALARQTVGGDATVVSLLTDPNADPHSHEATTSDAAYVAEATLVVENGAGYDTWFSKLVQARSSAPLTINVASLMHVRTGSNPHLFYDVAAAADFVKTLRTVVSRRNQYPTTASRATAVLTKLHSTEMEIASLRHSCVNVRVAATEDVTGYLLQALGLRVVTPERLRLAVGNSVDPSVGDLAVALSQLKSHPAFLVNNVQTATPLTDEMVTRARESHVPVINVTETMVGSNYVAWIDGVLAHIRAALAHEGCVK